MLELNKKINDLKKEYELKMEIFKERINYLENNNKISEENQNEYYEKNKKLLEKEEELDEREKKIIEKETIINQKLLFLEDKENYLEKENEQIEKYKIQFEIMKKEENYNKDLENEIINKKPKLKLNLKNPLALFKNPTLIGLNNIGATCFINATLQCLSQTEELTKYFLKEKKKSRNI